ncbi:MAG: acetyl-CoA C-acetyltransferase, partial [Bdellovibrionales bacterium]|nr:acetyl-CoA C-acetyltransferase [Bdellovibrionales bacterium]
MSQNVYVVSAQRTPIGSFQGSLSSIPATQLGSASISAAVLKTGLPNNAIDECIMGQVLTSGSGQAPARQAALGAGLPHSTPCMTINKVCGSGLKAIMLAADSIRLGNSNIVVAGGQESMSLAPHLLLNSRKGYRLGHIQA